MKKKTKTKASEKVAPVTKKESGDSLKMVLLGWLLSGLAFIAISILVPMFFGEGNFFAEDESIISSIWIYEIALFLIPVFVVSFIISLALSKESADTKDLKSVTRKALVVASVMNVVFIVAGLFFGEFLSLIGVNM